MREVTLDGNSCITSIKQGLFTTGMVQCIRGDLLKCLLQGEIQRVDILLPFNTYLVRIKYNIAEPSASMRQ